jgi:hypothetical protein
MKALNLKSSVAVVVIFLFSLLVYINTLDNGLVRDDKLVVLENKWITDIRFIPTILTSPVLDFEGTPGLSNQYRPAFHLYMMVGYALSGKASWGYHLINILFHAFSSLLVFLIISELLISLAVPRGSPAPAQAQRATFNTLLSACGALIFALHPINTEPVAWISAVSELSFAFFYLISLYLYIKSSKIGDRRYIASVFFFFISACSKESAATLPVVLIAYDLILTRSGLHETTKRLVPFAGAGLVYTALRLSTLNGVIPLKASHVADLSSFQLLINVPPLIVNYIGKLLLPISLNFDYVFDPVYSIAEPRAFIAAIISLFIIFLIWRFRLRARYISFALILIFVPLLPALYIPALGENTFAERYLYIPTVGFALLVVLIINKGVEFFGSKGYSLRGVNVRLAVLFFAVTITLYSYGTVTRNALWQNGYMLWGDTVHKSPDSRIARNNFAIELSKKGEFDRAIFHFKEALRIDPDSALTYNNLGVLYARSGKINEAVSAFQSSLELSPYDNDVANNLKRAQELLKVDDK